MARIKEFYSGSWKVICPARKQNNCTAQARCRIAKGNGPWTPFDGESEAIMRQLSAEAAYRGTEMALQHDPRISGRRPPDGECEVQVDIRNLRRYKAIVKESWEN